MPWTSQNPSVPSRLRTKALRTYESDIDLYTRREADSMRSSYSRHQLSDWEPPTRYSSRPEKTHRYRDYEDDDYEYDRRPRRERQLYESRHHYPSEDYYYQPRDYYRRKEDYSPRDYYPQKDYFVSRQHSPAQDYYPSQTRHPSQDYYPSSTRPTSQDYYPPASKRQDCDSVTDENTKKNTGQYTPGNHPAMKRQTRSMKSTPDLRERPAMERKTSFFGAPKREADVNIKTWLTDRVTEGSTSRFKYKVDVDRGGRR